MSTLRVALVGCGTVGSEVARLLQSDGEELAARAGAKLELAGVAVRRPDKPRPGINPALITADAEALVSSPDVDIVVEVVGGLEPAGELIRTALRAGKGVVSANKALLAEEAPALHALATEHGADLYYEAAVAGAIPLLRPLRESLAGDRVVRVLGVVNGTTNFILDEMDTHGSSFADALADAQSLGYAEADPTADVEGYDAAAKAAILAGIAFHTPVDTSDVHREGITAVHASDVSSAREMGAVVKLLSICEIHDDGSVGARVHPAMLPRTHPLSGVHGAYNAVVVETESAGRLMFYGPGAGGTETASAVLGDIITVARHRVNDSLGPVATWHADRHVRPIGDALTRYHMSLAVADRPGVLSQVSAVFAANDVSIETVRQRVSGDAAELVVVTHRANDAALAKTVQDLAEQEAVRDVLSVMRVEGE
ncbi:MAG TPA: homoserine dehydrogenase [Jiangellaceae bacterium]|nr:homoserine dehydrogenase [Jiangellaceae bacterium]